MHDYRTSAQSSLATTPHGLATNCSPSDQRLVTTSNVWTSYRERRASTTSQWPRLARSPSSVSNERGEHGSLHYSVSRPQTPPSRPPSPFQSVKRKKEPLQFLLPASHSSTGSGPDAPLSSKVTTAISDNHVNKPLQRSKITELCDADRQPACAVSLRPPVQFNQLGKSSADADHNIGYSSQSAPKNNHDELGHALSRPFSPPGSPCEELCIVSDYEDHTPKIEIIEPLESVCDSSSSFCSEENYRIVNPPILPKGSIPITPQQGLCNSERPMRDPASFLSRVDSPKFQAGPGWLARGKDCETWVEETLKASRELNFSRPRKDKLQRTIGVTDVPRLWISVDEDVAEKDSLHYAEVVAPTKPRVVNIPRHDSISTAGTSPASSSHCRAPSMGSAFNFDINTPAGGLSYNYVKRDGLRDGATRSVLDKDDLAATYMQRSVRAVSYQNSSVTSIHSLSSSTCELKPAKASLPHTPPHTPHRGRARKRYNDAPVKAAMTDKEKASTAAAQEAHPITPPQSPGTCSSTKPFSRKTFPKRMQSSMTRYPARLLTSASYPSLFSSDPVNLSWILDELEISIRAFPCTMLQLDSPVIQYFHSGQGWSTSQKMETGQVLRRHSSLISPPHNRCVPLLAPKMSSPHYSLAQANDSLTSPSQNPLRAVFPGAPAHLLNALHATTLALNHVCEFMTSFSTPTSTSGLTEIRRSSDVYHISRSPRRCRGPLDLTGIAPKARRMLGIDLRSRASLSATHLSSGSQAREHGNEPGESTPAEHGLKERGEKVRAGLRDMSRWLMEEIEKRTNSEGVEGRADALIMALGEVVRLGDKSRG